MRRLAVISGAQTELYELIFKEKEEESKEEESKEEEKKEKEEELGEKRENSMAIVMFPGNPGVLGFYFDFLTSIYQHFDQKIDVIGIGHLGHAHDCQKKREEEKEKEEEEEGKSSSVVPHARYSLDDQIEHKKEFLRSLPYSHIILAGHSIGAFICLEVLKAKDIESRVIKVFNIMPTIENLSDGFSFGVSQFVKPTMTEIIGWVAHLLPKWIMSFFLGDSHSKYSQLILDHVSYNVVTNILFMAHTEAHQVKEMSSELISLIDANISKMSFLYSPSDPYTPSHLIDKVKANWPQGDVTLTDPSIPHAYVLHPTGSEVVAEFVCTKIDALLQMISLESE